MLIAPELFVRRGRAAVEFYAAAFGAVVDHLVGDDDAIVAQLSVGDATFWVHDERALPSRPSSRATTTKAPH